MAEDSSDMIENNFTSSQWGKGTTEFVAKHYQTAQLNRNKAEDLSGTKGKGKNASAKGKNNKNSRSPSGRKNNEKVTSEDLQKLILSLEQARDLKKQLKHNSLNVEHQRMELEELLKSQLQDNDSIVKSIKQVQAQIEEESERLRLLEEKRLRDIEFVEQAFYTSNEEGMGVSPNLFDDQNQMPRRPGTRDKKDNSRMLIMPLIDPMAEL